MVFLIVFHCYCCFYVYDRQHFLEGSYILSSNHSSYMDMPALMLAAGRPFKEFSMLVVKDYFLNREGMTFFP